MMRARLELVLAILCGVAAIATAIWPTWIETLTRLEPDGGSGGTEWWLVAVLGLAALTAALLARRDLRAVRMNQGR